MPDFERELAGYSQDGNRELLSALDRTLEAARTGDPIATDDGDG